MSNIDHKPTCGHSGVEWNEHGECITCARDRVLNVRPIWQFGQSTASDIDRKIDEILELLSAESFDAAINNPDDYMLVLNSSTEKAKQAILALINEARVDENKYWRRRIGEHSDEDTSYFTERIAQLKPDTTLEGGE